MKYWKPIGFVFAEYKDLPYYWEFGNVYQNGKKYYFERVFEESFDKFISPITFDSIKEMMKYLKIQTKKESFNTCTKLWYEERYKLKDCKKIEKNLIKKERKYEQKL